MKLTTIAGGLLAVLVITGSAAALPGAAGAQADAHADNAEANTATEQAANETTTANENESGGAAEAADRRGPPADAGQAADQRGPPSALPEQVPDFVSEIHTLIDQKQAGELTGNLGEQISDLTPSEESDATANESGDADDADEEPTGETDSDGDQ
ncbi:hypothetical protein BVU17_10830 [Haloarcula taiwanensis]|uniref:Uncharacterized protein n=1 Tax=Haloarcula taiwanensis TaxID=1932004 RepID=A0A2H4ZZX8_9EURY|nr:MULTISPECIES: hypothetical protein [Haloarcula]AUG47987.1 hypothetical protein BVU17_10830 [Haloarcula taiwanensis]RLM39343.1 hypothetical protein DVK01_01940 [Haloarcula sp. Atlit-120R]RLM97487.1 hypothetical protein D3D01_06715 [Haloarcula sp. Atlit-7R]